MSNVNDAQQQNDARKQITLLQPENINETITYTVDANTDIVLGFEASQAIFSKSTDGSDLIFTFRDVQGNVISSIIIEDFYVVFSADVLPSFFVPSNDSNELRQLTAKDFFNNDENLIPASNNDPFLVNDPTGTNPITPALLIDPEPVSFFQPSYPIPDFTRFLGQNSFLSENRFTNDPTETPPTETSSAPSSFLKPDDITNASNEIEAMIANNSNENNFIIKNLGADTLVINTNGQYSMYANDSGKNEIGTGADNDSITLKGNMGAYGGGNTINGGDDNDFIWIEGNFSTNNGGKNTINGGADDDLIKLSDSGLSFTDVFIDGGEDASDNTVEMDVLLTNVNNLQSIKDAINNNAIGNIEIAINGDVQGESVQEVLNNLGITQNGDKVTFNNPTDWKSNNNSGVQNYTEYTKTENGETITLLIQTGLINT